jgi:hypothetical protein
MSATVYTAIFGGFDELHQPVPQNEPCEFICFTDAKMPARVGAWRIIHVPLQPDIQPRMQAKRFKLLSHKIFPGGRLAACYAPFSQRRNADLSIWMDGSLRIKSPAFVRDMRTNVAGADWAMFAHPWRDCIYEEASASLVLPKYKNLLLAEQVDAYRPAVPAHAGLYACGVILRREPASALVVRANEMWWDETLRWTAQDQLSLPYVIRRVGGCEPRSINENIFANRWFDFIPHPTENRL